MGSGFRTFATSEVLTASNVQNFLMEQSVMSFASTGARDVAITAPEAGMVAYIRSNDSSEGLYHYTSASSWRKGPGWNAPWGVQLYATDTSTRTFTTAATITNITGSVATINNRYYRATFSCRFYNSIAGVQNSFNLRFNGSTFWAGQSFNTSTTLDEAVTISAIYKATSSTTASFDVTASAASGTLSIFGGNATTQLIVEDIGPHGAPA